MQHTVLFWPAILQFLLTAACYAYIGLVRRNLVAAGRVPTTDFAPGEEPQASADARRLIANQFELPMLFFAVIAFLYAIAATSILELALALAFVASRIVHAFALIRGPLALRHMSFFVGFLLLAALWADLAIRLLQF